MAEKLECPDCHAMFTRNGLPLHRLAKHSGGTLLQGAPEVVIANPVKSTQKEDSPMGEFCPECQKKEFAAQLAERDHKDALKEAVAEATRARAELAEALATKDQPQEPQPQHMPDFDTFIQHCTGGSCSTHASQLEDYRLSVGEDVVKNLSLPENRSHLKDIMAAAGVEEMPEKIIIKGLPVKMSRGANIN